MKLTKIDAGIYETEKQTSGDVELKFEISNRYSTTNDWLVRQELTLPNHPNVAGTISFFDWSYKTKREAVEVVKHVLENGYYKKVDQLGYCYFDN